MPDPSTPLSEAREVMHRAFAALRVHLTQIHAAAHHAHALSGGGDTTMFTALSKEREQVEAAAQLLESVLMREAGRAPNS